MALQIWLPMDKNLNNQGLSDTIVTNNGATLNSNGKIGNTFHFTENGYCTLSSAIIPSESTDFSCAYWVKENSNNTVSSFRGVYNCGGFLIGQYGSNFNVYNTSGGCDVVTSIDSTKWTHCCVTFSKDKVIRLYVNGELKKEGSATKFSSSGTVSYLGRRVSGGTNQYNDMYLNDFRIYDHCLSAKEVSEIAKGLVLHYPLNNSGFGAPNLINDSTLYSKFPTNIVLETCNNPTGYNFTFGSLNITSGTGGNRNNGYGFKIYNLNMTAGTKITFSVDVKGTGSKISIWFFGSDNNWWTGTSYHTTFTEFFDWTRISVTGTIPSPAPTKVMLGLHVGISDKSAYFKNAKLEEGSIATPWIPNSSDTLYSTMGLNSTTEYDCSGYSNNGTRSEALIYNSNSARYNGCYNITGLNYIATQNINFENIDGGTLSFWIKFNNFNNWTHYVFFANSFNWMGEGHDFIIVANNNSLSSNTTSTNINIDCCSYNNNFTAYINTWYHIVITWDKNNYIIKKYVNGELKATNDDSTNKRLDTYSSSHNYHFIGNGLKNSSYSGDFNISDFRIYTTTLSADDIKELYSIPLSIDKEGNSYAYDYLEGNTPNISKAGILENKEINENSVVNYIEKSYQGKSYSYIPSTANNFCMSNIIVNYSNYTPGDKLYVKIDVEWSGFDETNTSETFNIYFQGSQYSTSSSSFVWSGSNYACSALNKAQPLKNLVLSSSAGKKTIVGSFTSTTYPSEYSKAYIGIRSDYSNGIAKLTISNAEVIPEKYYIDNNFQMGKNYITANQIIEY